MSRSFQQLIIMGNLGKDPELRYTPNGQAVCQFSVATSRSWKKDDEWQEETTWFRVTAWGPAAERAAENLVKGAFVRVVGRITTRDYQNKEGQTVHTWEVVSERVDSLEKREGSGGYTRADDAYVDQLAASRGQQPVATGAPRATTEALDEPPFDDLPF